MSPVFALNTVPFGIVLQEELAEVVDHEQSTAYFGMANNVVETWVLLPEFTGQLRGVDTAILKTQMPG